MTTHVPMISVERGMSGGFAIYDGEKLAKACNDAESALVGVADLLGVALVKDVPPCLDVYRAACCVVELLDSLHGAPFSHKVVAIKAIRALTGVGIKDAKEALEDELANRGIR